ncbi:hypothetical protein [Alkalihalobacterium alkalinitrilicum]|uniref:hypothetical protein n=1 Tax=Alkalihalobacterium alkalinitrilicum TaxID=427920 RepID=UPI0009957DFD|nr:hypothetical protein [Alkalihalobacterium alkalinitrilicum]
MFLTAMYFAGLKKCFIVSRWKMLLGRFSRYGKVDIYGVERNYTDLSRNSITGIYPATTGSNTPTE